MPVTLRDFGYQTAIQCMVICATRIEATAANAASGIALLSYAVGCAHQVYDAQMASGLDMLLCYILIRCFSRSLSTV
jgi:hypothetical protein